MRDFIRQEVKFMDRIIVDMKAVAKRLLVGGVASLGF